MRFTPALMLLLLVACTGAGDRLPVGGELQVEGPVLRVDLEPMTRDGDGRIRIRDAGHGAVVILVPARRDHLCSADYALDVNGIEAGTMLRARGTVTQRGELLVCAGDTHFLGNI